MKTIFRFLVGPVALGMVISCTAFASDSASDSEGERPRKKRRTENSKPVLPTPEATRSAAEAVDEKPYTEEEVEIPLTNGCYGQLAGTLRLPKTDHPVPAVLMIPGSGPYSRTFFSEIGLPFLEKTMVHSVLADYLARNGIASLVVDKRHYGKSDCCSTMERESYFRERAEEIERVRNDKKKNFMGNGAAFWKTSIEDSVSDALAWINYLKTRREIDSQKLGLVGKSEGGVIASMLAASKNDIAFLVMLAPYGLTGQKIIREQSCKKLMRDLQARGLPLTDVTGIERITNAVFEQKEMISATTSDEEARANLMTGMQPFFEGFEKLAGRAFWTLEAKNAMYDLILCRHQRALAAYSNPAALLQVEVSVLVLFAENDDCVCPDLNKGPLVEILKNSRCSDYTVKTLAGFVPGGEHDFVYDTRPEEDQIDDLDMSFFAVAPWLLEEVCGWIKVHTGSESTCPIHE